MRAIDITKVDLERLCELVGVARSYAELDQEGLKGLETELDRASIVPAQSAPPDVITMHSQFRIRDLDTSEEMVFTLLVRPLALDPCSYSFFAAVTDGLPLGWNENGQPGRLRRCSGLEEGASTR